MELLNLVDYILGVSHARARDLKGDAEHLIDLSQLKLLVEEVLYLLAIQAVVVKDVAVCFCLIDLICAYLAS